MSWSNELREWHPYAMKSLETANLPVLQIPSSDYKRLTETETHGINMNVIAILANNIERRTPQQMDMSVSEFQELITLNDKVAASWEAMVAPIRKEMEEQYEKRYQIMKGTPRQQPVIAQA